MGQQPLQYQSGTPSLQSPRAIPVFLGKKWAEHSSLAEGVENALHPIMQGVFMKSLSDQYSVGAEIGYGSVAPRISLDQQSDGTDFSSLNDTQLENTINDLANNQNSTQSPGDIYVIYPEPGSNLQLQSLKDNVAYHDMTNNGNVFCIVPFPDVSTIFENDNQVFPTKLNYMTMATSHEISEAVINPNPNFKNWVTQGGLEPADQCTAIAKWNIVAPLLQQFPNGTVLQQNWNPETNSCEIVPGAKEPFTLIPDFIGVTGASVIAAGIGTHFLNKYYPGNPLNKFILKPLGKGIRSLSQGCLNTVLRRGHHPDPDIEVAVSEHELDVNISPPNLPSVENRNNGIAAVAGGSGPGLGDRGVPQTRPPSNVLVTPDMSSSHHRESHRVQNDLELGLRTLPPAQNQRPPIDRQANGLENAGNSSTTQQARGLQAGNSRTGTHPHRAYVRG